MSSSSPGDGLGTRDEEVSEATGTTGSSSRIMLTNSSCSNPCSVATGVATGVLYNSVWDFPKMERRGGPDSVSKTWFCGWCGSSFRSWNATKALHHVSKSKGNNDVKPCNGSIPKDQLAIFQSFRFQKLGASDMKKQHQEAFSDKVSANQQSISVMMGEKRIRASKSGGKLTEGVVNVGDTVCAMNATRLTSAIADFIYCKGLSFSAVDNKHFLQILKLSRLVPPSYRPPTRKFIARNELLQLSYDNLLQKYKQNLEMDSTVFGLSLFGDGATVHGMPLMNVLAAGVGEPSACLAIIDCKLLRFEFIVWFDSNLLFVAI